MHIIVDIIEDTNTVCIKVFWHTVFFLWFLECPIRSVTYHMVQIRQKIWYIRDRGTIFCKMSGGLDISWLDEIQKNNPLKRCQKISACAQNTVKERAVVCRWCANAFNQIIIIQPFSIWREKFLTYFTRQNSFMTSNF